MEHDNEDFKLCVVKFHLLSNARYGWNKQHFRRFLIFQII